MGSIFTACYNERENFYESLLFHADIPCYLITKYLEMLLNLTMLYIYVYLLQKGKQKWWPLFQQGLSECATKQILHSVQLSQRWCFNQVRK